MPVEEYRKFRDKLVDFVEYKFRVGTIKRKENYPIVRGIELVRSHEKPWYPAKWIELDP